MKIRLDLEATPAELRAFFGLPDVEPLQRELMDRIRENMLAGMQGFDPMSLMKPFLPSNLQSIEALQRSFWEAFSRSGPPPQEPPLDTTG
jgi:hypothetical protein